MAAITGINPLYIGLLIHGSFSRTFIRRVLNPAISRILSLCFILPEITFLFADILSENTFDVPFTLPFPSHFDPQSADSDQVETFPLIVQPSFIFPHHNEDAIRLHNNPVPISGFQAAPVIEGRIRR